jgi:lactaldehyde dehydrogenase/glycolaldehyde dehydrogenase
LELGGKAPLVVWKDADMELAVKCAIVQRYGNCGQICTCNERMYVHRDIFEGFLEKFVGAVEAIRVKDPMSTDAQMGPLVSADQRLKVEKAVEKAVADGVKIVTGGERPKGDAFKKGFWYSPTVMTEVRQEMDIVQEEIFGPVVPIIQVSDLEDTLRLCNDSKYGLASYVFSEDMGTVMRFTRGLQYGEVFVNSPGWDSRQGYHGGWRHSGVGGDFGKYGLEEFLQKKTVYLRYGGASAFFG